MSTLKDRLDRIRSGFVDQAPAEVLEVMNRAKQELIDSGIAGSMVKPGDILPAFILPDSDGGTVNSEELLARGPLVVTLYRGLW